MKKVLFAFIVIALACSCNNNTNIIHEETQAKETDNREDAFLRDKAASDLSLAYEVLLSSSEFKSDTTGLREAIIANGGQGFSIMLEASPYGDIDAAEQSNHYIFALREEYETHSLTTKRYAYDPQNRRLLKEDFVNDEYYPIPFDNDLVEY